MVKKILALAAHPDDIEYSCYGTLAKEAFEASNTEVYFVIFTNGEISASPEQRKLEAQQSALNIGAYTVFFDYPDGCIPVDKHSVGKTMNLVRQFNPDTVYLPHWDDTHQDHVAVSRIGLAACRWIDNMYLCEMPHTGYGFQPDTYVNITDFLDEKREALLCHESQHGKQCLDVESVLQMARNHGYKLGHRDNYFEAFETVRRLTW
jgi:LmbE family N-acetylglucosaminyl deacetylase